MMLIFTQASSDVTNDVVSYIKTRLVHLLKEVDELPLTHRDNGSWSKFHNAAMKKFNSLSSL
jgi:hypothetical protein